MDRTNPVTVDLDSDALDVLAERGVAFLGLEGTTVDLRGSRLVLTFEGFDALLGLRLRGESLSDVVVRLASERCAD